MVAEINDLCCEQGRENLVFFLNSTLSTALFYSRRFICFTPRKQICGRRVTQIELTRCEAAEQAVRAIFNSATELCRVSLRVTAWS